MTDQKPDPIILPAPRDPDDEYTAGEFAGVEEPEINLERIERFRTEYRERMKREDPEQFRQLEELRKRRLS
jgi:hypothetical protein